MTSIKLLSLVLIFIITVLAGLYPFIKKLTSDENHEFPNGEALAAGVFLGAGLIHMLGDASSEFTKLHYHYPWAFLLAGVMFLILLWFEHVGREVYEHDSEASPRFAILAVIMLSIHSFLAGAALGLSDSLSMVFIILFAILAHKWAASFSLAVQINKSSLSFKSGLSLFFIFTLMVPLGILMGSEVSAHMTNHPLLEPIFSALAAGTFLYLGTLHGLKQAVMVKQCCNLKRFSFVILGFAIMALVAVWT